MLKIFNLILLSFLISSKAFGLATEYYKYFKVDMDMELPKYEEYLKKLNKTSELYDRGYDSRFDMGTSFKKEFSKVIKAYGHNECRIKTDYEDMILDYLKMLPQSAYQYIGPMLHQVPGMPEKILNMPGIKETKNKFPKDIAPKLQGIENLEFLSPFLYTILMPEMWEKKNPNLDKPQPKKAKRPKVNIELPDFLKKKIGLPVKLANKEKSSANKKSKLSAQIRTINPTLTTPLTTKDVETFLETIDDVVDFGMKNNKQNYFKLIVSGSLLDMWEAEQKTAIQTNVLKDLVNPCQRLIIKIKLADLYEDFMGVVAQKGFSPEEWAYTCDKTFKAYRVANAEINQAYAVSYHRKGYYDKYISSLPEKWQKNMYATQAALIRMYAVNADDVDIVRPFKDEITKKLTDLDGDIISAPIVY